MACAAPAMASDAPARPMRLGGGEADLRFVPLGIGKSVVIDLPRDAKDVLVAESGRSPMRSCARHAAPT